MKPQDKLKAIAFVILLFAILIAIVLHPLYFLATLLFLFMMLVIYHIIVS